MNLKDKINAESMDTPVILLYREGLFWKAYEQSAMRFVKEIRNYKLQKKYVKALTGDVVSLGFPDSRLKDLLVGKEFVQMDEARISVCANECFTREAFDCWKSEIVSPDSQPQVANPAEANKKIESPHKSFPVASSATEKQVIAQLMAFSVETASPLQCMMLISELQTRLKQ